MSQVNQMHVYLRLRFGVWIVRWDFRHVLFLAPYLYLFVNERRRFSKCS
jgi:hypothetical protein